MTPKLPRYLIIALIFSITSCTSKGESTSNILDNIFSSDLSEESIQNAINIEKEIKSQDTSSFWSAELDNTYQQNSYSPLWIKENKLSKNAIDLINNIGKLNLEGLNPEDYNYERLKTYLNNTPSNEDSLAQLEVLLTKSVINIANDMTYGVVNVDSVDKEWHADNDSMLSVSTLLSNGSLMAGNILDAFRPKNPRYKLMLQEAEKWEMLKTDSTYLKLKERINSGDNSVVEALIKKEIKSEETDSNLIKSYQYFNQLSRTGKIDAELINTLKRNPDQYLDKLKLNMERLRWLPHNLEDEYIWVSIPQAEVDYFKSGNNLFHDRSIVGSKAHHTPTIYKPMKNIVICPPWGVPLSIVKNEYRGRIPARYQVFRGGKRVPNSMVNASNYKQFAVRQAPGPSAALGYVKFNLPNKWDIYLHDTPNRNLFGNKTRYMSHGCVRVKNPRDLAAIILEDKGVGIDSINNVIKRNRTSTYQTHEIPVYISYFTVNVDSTLKNVMYLNDPYKKDSVLAYYLLKPKK